MNFSLFTELNKLRKFVHDHLKGSHMVPLAPHRCGICSITQSLQQFMAWALPQIYKFPFISKKIEVERSKVTSARPLCITLILFNYFSHYFDKTPGKNNLRKSLFWHRIQGLCGGKVTGAWAGHLTPAVRKQSGER